jgi:flagellar motor protein MotB
MNKDGVFSKLDGAPAQLMIILGLVLLLAVPMITSYRSSGMARAQTALNQVDSLSELDLDDLKRSQEKERKADQEAAEKENSTPLNYATMPPEQIQQQQQQRQAAMEKRQERERERQKVFDDKREELKKKYDANARKRDLLVAQAAASGGWSHHVLLFLGNVLLLVGLLVVTLQSDGLRQKIALIILLVVMFSALSGVNLTFLTAGSMGERNAPNLERLLK